VKETKALTAKRVRLLFTLPGDGDDVITLRDRALLKAFIYTGGRLDTICRFQVGDLYYDGDEYTIRLREKGNKRRTVGLHFDAGRAITEYIEAAGLESGPLFRSRRAPRSDELSDRAMSDATAYNVVVGYLSKIPGAMQAQEGGEKKRCVYSPHTLRATLATLLLELGIDITKVQEQLGHKHLTTTQVYDKRRRKTTEGASLALTL
jgi:integrase